LGRRRKSGRKIHGVIMLDKPLGITSNDCLQKVRRLFDANRAGHTGSLDPLATGVLPICFGEATKYAQYGLDADKSYVAHAKLGATTETGDSEGEVVCEKPVPMLSIQDIEKVFKQFSGRIEQIPSMYSALKHNGKPLYEYARQGIEVERPARSINIYELNLIEFTGQEIKFSVRCSKGTYIRTLAEDIGNTLGCGAHLVGLRRTAVADHALAGCYSMEALNDIAKNARIRETNDYGCLDELLLPVDQLVNYLPKIMLDSANTESLLYGQKVRIPALNLPAGVNRLYSSDSGLFIGIGERDQTDPEVLSPVRLISTVSNPT